MSNVTPFRPRRPPPKVARGPGLSSHRGKAVLVQAMTLAAFSLEFALQFFAPFRATPLGGLVGLLPMVVGIIGVFVAVANRRDAMPWATTHHEHALRTLMFGFSIIFVAQLVLGMLLGSFVPGMGLVILGITVAVLIWVAIRAGVGVVLAVLRKPIPHPKGIFL